MNYDKDALRAKALEIKAAHMEKAKQQHARHLADYDKQLKRWQEVEKAVAVKRVQEALALIKKDQPIGSRLDYRLPSPPQKPSEADCCTPMTQKIDALVELLDTMSDDTISASALARAGVKDIAALLRRPC